MITLTRSGVLALGAIIGLLLLFYGTTAHRNDSGLWRVAAGRGRLSASDAVGNATLGVERIISMNVAERFDKRAALSLAASLSDIDIMYMDAPRPSELNLKGLPPCHDSLKGGSLASFLAHANVWRRQVFEGWRTTLVLEDDSDWDVEIKEELKALAEPLTRLSSKVESRMEKTKVDPLDPYNSADWDLVYLGHCIEIPAVEDIYLAYTDPHVPSWDVCDRSVQDIFDYYGHKLPNTPDHPETAGIKTRLVQKSNKPVCTTAYMVSLRGAKKLLHLTSRYWYTALDLQVMDYIEDDRIRSFSVEPPLMTQWKDNDAYNSDLDMANVKNGPVKVHKNPDAKGGPWYNVQTSIRAMAQDILFTNTSRSRLSNVL